MKVLRSAAGDVKPFHLLGLCEWFATRADGEQPAGAGTPADPYKLTNSRHWVWCWRNSNKEQHYEILGRLIRKAPNHYVSDQGPAYLTKPRGAEQVADRLGIQPTTVREPKYREVAEAFEAPGTILYPEGGEKAFRGNARAAIFNSPAMATKMSELMRGRLPLGELGRYDPNYSRMQSYLPVVMAAMFIAESARNRRAWPINLMILELMANQVWTFPWSDIFWHPLDRAGLQEPDGGYGIDAPGKTDRTLSPVIRRDQLHLVGGKMPASPTMGGMIGKIPLINTPGRNAANGTFKSQPPVFDFIHQKEVDVILSWLMSKAGVSAQWRLEEVSDASTLLPPAIVMGARKPELRAIHTEIGNLVNGPG
jgi:hypothetical protein